VFLFKCIKEEDIILLPHGTSIVKALKKTKLIR